MSFAIYASRIGPRDGKSRDAKGRGQHGQRGETNNDHVGGHRDALKKISPDSRCARTDFRRFTAKPQAEQKFLTAAGS